MTVYPCFFAGPTVVALIPTVPTGTPFLPRAEGHGDGGTSDGIGDGGGRHGDGGQGPGPGYGHTRSLDSDEQKSLIFWYKYYFCSIESPLGAMRGGSSLKDGTQSFLWQRLCSTSSESRSCFTRTTPGFTWEKRMWCCAFMLGILLKCCPKYM